MIPQVAIIGAGISGLVACDRLLARGIGVTLIDKGRRAGGRLCTRTVPLQSGRTATFDLGPPLLYARRPNTRQASPHREVPRLVQKRLNRDRWLVPRQIDCVGAYDEVLSNRPSFGESIPSGMRELAFQLLGHHHSAVDFRDHTVAERLEYQDDQWKISTRSLIDGSESTCRALAILLTAPVPQALELLATSGIALPDDLKRSLQTVSYSRSMALYGLFPDAASTPHGIAWLGDGAVEWIVDNRAKGISETGPAITALTSHEWADENWHESDETLIGRLCDELQSWLGQPSTDPPVALQRWRYARPLTPLSASCGVVRDCHLVLAGDSFSSHVPDAVDAAIVSGIAGANRMAGLIAHCAHRDSRLTLSRPRRYALEIAVSTPDEAVVAVQAGADRLELSSGLEVGGLTPSLHLFQAVRQAVAPIPVYVLIRPRSGGFCYTDREFEVMVHDARHFMEMGASGIVFGILKGTAIDRERCRQLLQVAPQSSVFHRAFDQLSEPFAAIDELIDLGFERLLTSGRACSAEGGATLLAALVHHAGWQIEILPAGSIRPENVADLIRETRCEQVHASARSPVVVSRLSPPLRPLENMGMDRSGGWLTTSFEIVTGLRRALDQLVGQDDEDSVERA